MKKDKKDERPGCEACDHWDEGTESSDEVRWGFCDRNPPAVVASPDPDEEYQCARSWTVLPHRCGEHKQRLQ